MCNRRKDDLINLHENWVTEPLWGMMIAFLTLDFNYGYIIGWPLAQVVSRASLARFREEK